MSVTVSTGAIGSCSDPTRSLAENSEVVIEEWKDELADSINIYEGDIDQFLSTFVPSSSLPPPKRLPPSLFRGRNPRQGKEALMYPVLLDAFDKLVDDAPTEKRLSFSICADQLVPFPFEDHADHHKTKPDLVVSFPGKNLPRQQVDPSWQNFSMVMEAKATEGDDPFDREGEKHINSLVQLATSARNLFFAHGFLAAFVVGLYGDHARIARFDHACAVVSPRFPYKLRPELLRQFFWRFSHPCVGTTVVGCDPAVRNLDSTDIEWVKGCLAKKGGNVAALRLRDEDMLKGRHVTVPVCTTFTDAHTRDLILFDLIDVDSGLLSRATMVWLAIEDKQHSMADPESGLQVPAVVVYKENWHRIDRRPETDFYDRLDAIAGERTGLPKMLFGSDVGDREVRVWKAGGGVLPPPYDAPSPGSISTSFASSESCSSSPVSSSSLSSSASLLFSSAGASTSSLDSEGGNAPTEVEEDSSEDSEDTLPTCPPLPPPNEYPLPFPQYQTHTWRCLFGEEEKDRERSLIRTVVDVVGRPLTCFRSTRELVEAMRDALKGHKQAWDVGILQRDVSVGNILITEDPTERCRGFLHDFDCSSMTKALPMPDDPGSLDPLLRTAESDPDGRVRTGTYYYFSIPLLFEKNVRHTLYHDLESFYWVLLYVVLRHTRHDYDWEREHYDPCDGVFRYGRDYDAACYKMGWIMRAEGSLTITDNGPLTDVLRHFNELIMTCTIIPIARVPSDRPRPRQYITHEKVLKIFDDALAREDWPSADGEADAAVPFTRRRRDRSTVSSGRSKRKMDSGFEPDDDSLGTRSKKARSMPAQPARRSLRSWNGGGTGEGAARRKCR